MTCYHAADAVVVQHFRNHRLGVVTCEILNELRITELPVTPDPCLKPLASVLHCDVFVRDCALLITAAFIFTGRAQTL